MNTKKWHFTTVKTPFQRSWVSFTVDLFSPIAVLQLVSPQPFQWSQHSVPVPLIGRLCFRANCSRTFEQSRDWSNWGKECGSVSLLRSAAVWGEGHTVLRPLERLRGDYSATSVYLVIWFRLLATLFVKCLIFLSSTYLLGQWWWRWWWGSWRLVCVCVWGGGGGDIWGASDWDDFLLFLRGEGGRRLEGMVRKSAPNHELPCIRCPKIVLWRPKNGTRACCQNKAILPFLEINSRVLTNIVPALSFSIVICYFLTLHSQEWSSSNFSCSLTSHIISHSMENLAFHSLLRLKDDSCTSSHYLTYTFLLKRLGECTFWAWDWKG